MTSSGDTGRKTGYLSVLKLIKPKLSRDVGLIWLRDRELAPAARGFATVFEGMWRRSEKPMREKE